MTNFIFKSQGTYKKLVLKLEVIQSELRHQRVDMSHVINMLEKLVTDKNLQTQVDEYFEKDPFGSAFSESLKETSPQTDSDEQ